MERLNQRSYPPDTSAIPSQNCDIWCQLAEPVANCCGTHVISHAPAGGGAMVISKLLVIPPEASVMTLLQSTTPGFARSAGVRAPPARDPPPQAFARRMNWPRG